MLSRVADSLYWMGRYVERAENTARVLDVHLQLTLDGSHGHDPASPALWAPIVKVAGDDDQYHSERADRDSVLRFYCGNAANPNSILACLAAARENARSVRDTISSNMWRHINEAYLWAKEAADRLPPEGFFERVKRDAALFHGLADTSMTHGEGWHFLSLGRHLERADKTSRIIEVKAVALMGTDVRATGSTGELNQWSALLRSVSAFEMYRKRYARTLAPQVLEFLILDPDFPRSCRSCVRAAHDSLLAIAGIPAGTGRLASERRLGRLRADLDYSPLEELLTRGIPAWCDGFQARLIEASSAVYDDFLAPVTPG